MAERDEALRAVQEWEARCQQLEAEAEALQNELQRQEMELANGRADAETRGAAVAGLESMLTNLMKAAAQGRHSGKLLYGCSRLLYGWSSDSLANDGCIPDAHSTGLHSMEPK